MDKVRKTKSAGGVVLNPEGKVLVVDQRTSWSLPKGHIKKGETELEAARREIYEESGVKNLDLVRSLGSYRRYKISKDGKGDNESEWKTIYMFLFKTEDEKLQPIDKNNPQAEWLDKEKVVGRLTHRKDKQFFLSVIDML